MSFASSLRLAAAVAVIACAAQAQVVVQESMTNWTHAGTTGWTDDFTLSGSFSGKVDRLDSATSLNYTRTLNTLKKGHYVATIRVQKFKDNVGTAPLTLEVIGAGKTTEETITFSQLGENDVKVGQWIWLQSATFTVAADNAPVLFRLYNLDTQVTKQNYYFDEFKVGAIPEGKALKYQSLDLDYAPWTGAWVGNTTYFAAHTPEKSSAFGEVAKLNYVSWMEFKSYYGWNSNQPVHHMVLQPGTYTINWRVQVPTSGAQPIDMIYNINSTGNVTRTWATAEQVAGQWQLTPNVSFTITQKDTPVRFIFRNIASTSKSGFAFDSFMVRAGAFDVSGTACKSSLGDVLIDGNVPQLGEPFTTTVTGVPQVAVFFIGAQATSVDMSPAGMTGCTLYTLPMALFPATAAANVAALTIPVPNDTTLLGAAWYQQAFVLDAQANNFGGALSTVGKALIAN
ncbi:MAG: hypothetical protein R3F30_02530 [Planctomycetota bacterium]